MRCEEIENRFSPYLEGDLEPAERRVIEDHLQECVRCRQELELLRRTVVALQSLEELEVPARLTAAIQAGVHAHQGSRWQRLASWLFFPIHIKLPLEAMALLLVTLGAVYLYRSAPELSQAPQPPVATESAPRGEAVPSTAAGRADRLDRAAPPAVAQKSDRLEPAVGQAPAEGPGARAEIQEERESLRQRELGGALRKEAAKPSRAAPLVSELTLKTQDPSHAASRIAEIANAMGGRLVEPSDPRQSAPDDLHRLALAIPPEAYPRFVNAHRELGDLSPLPGEPPAAPSPEETVIVYLRLTR
jgi:hypothetical protein